MLRNTQKPLTYAVGRRVDLNDMAEDEVKRTDHFRVKVEIDGRGGQKRLVSDKFSQAASYGKNAKHAILMCEGKSPPRR